MDAASGLVLEVLEGGPGSEAESDRVKVIVQAADGGSDFVAPVTRPHGRGEGGECGERCSEGEDFGLHDDDGVQSLGRISTRFYSNDFSEIQSIGAERLARARSYFATTMTA